MYNFYMPCLVVCALEGAGQSVCPKEGLGLCFCATPSNMLSPLQCLSLPVHSGLWGKCVPHPQGIKQTYPQIILVSSPETQSMHYHILPHP